MFSSCSSYCFRNPGGQSRRSMRARIGARYFSCTACASGEIAESGKNVRRADFNSKSPLSPAWLRITFIIEGTSTAKKRHALELCLFLKFVRISQSIPSQKVRFELFFNLCLRSLASKLQSKTKHAHGRPPPGSSAPGHYSQHLEDQRSLRHPRYATRPGYRFLTALGPALI